VFEIEANAFLYHMVRRTVRLLVDVAQDKLLPGRIEQHLKNGNDDPIRGMAPPNGLFLTQVRYEERKD
jgi:tRNA pseudouridine38-40 synthase